MLKNRIIATLQFFDLQDYPLTLLELSNFLLPEKEDLKSSLDENWEIKQGQNFKQESRVFVSDILKCLETECVLEVECLYGFYCLLGRKNIIKLRFENYYFGILREKRITKYIKYLKYLPFVRGVAIGGSQAMGKQTENSDIDLFILAEPNFLGIARFFITTFFQIFGVRRHGKKVANRFCLNHYLVEGRGSIAGRDLYNAMEYLRLRPVVYKNKIFNFVNNELDWISFFFPNAKQYEENSLNSENKNYIQNIGEKIFTNSFGVKIEKWLINTQIFKIQKGGNFVVASLSEMAFHSLIRKREFLSKFFTV